MTIHQSDFDSVGSEVTFVERRREERLVTTYRAARIVTARGQEQLGIIRNVSIGGVMIETHADIAVGDRIWIEPRACQPVWGAVVWSEVLRHGVVFDQALPDASLLTLTTPESPNQVVRAPRITVDMPARLYVAGTWRTVRLCDVSQGGAKVDCAALLAEAEPAVLAIPGLGDVQAFVRWQGKGRVGLLFAEPLSIGMLSAWITARVPAPPAPHAARPAGAAQDVDPC